MNKLEILIIAMILGTAAVNGQTVVISIATCQPATTLTALGFGAQTAALVNNGTCRSYYASNGACVAPGQVIQSMNNNNAWLKQQAINANNFALQFINATIYFQTQNGHISSSTTANSSNSWSSSFSSFFSNFYNRATSLFQSASTWVQKVFSNTVNQVNPCFQAWANITNGAYCVVTSSSNVSYTTNTLSPSNPVTLNVDPTSTGNALQACASLVDTYCSLTYGISTSNSASPFNQTFNWNDGGLSSQDCYNFRNQTNCTTCGAVLNSLWTNLFNTAWIKFVPSSSSITNLGTFLTATSNQTVSSYKPVAQTQNGVGINLAAASTVNVENIYKDGQNSGQDWVYYGSASSLYVAVVSALIAVMI